MKLKKVTAVYTIIIGISMIIMWLLLISTDQVSEIKTEPIKITYHLIAEFLTAALLVIAGFGLFTNQKWSFHMFLISLGMLLYTVIVSAGYYAEKGDIAMISQSGAMLTGMMDYSMDQAYGFSCNISLGNKADMDEVDFIEYLVDDENTKVILCYLESIENGDKFLKVVSFNEMESKFREI